MSYYQCYCECKHADHAEGGPGHPRSMKIPEEEAVPYGYDKGYQIQMCRACVGAGHMKVTS